MPEPTGREGDRRGRLIARNSFDLGVPRANVKDERAKHFEAIGRAVVAAAAVDDKIAQYIGGLVTEETPVGRILTSKMGFQQRADVFSALVAYRTKNKKLLAASKAFIGRTQKAMERRDHFAHSLWGSSPLDEKLSRGKHKADRRYGLVLASEELTVEELNAVATELEACYELARISLCICSRTCTTSPFSHQAPMAS